MFDVMTFLLLHGQLVSLILFQLALNSNVCKSRTMTVKWLCQLAKNPILCAWKFLTIISLDVGICNVLKIQGRPLHKFHFKGVTYMLRSRETQKVFSQSIFRMVRKHFEYFSFFCFLDTFRKF